jgi:hypothetical protein
MQLAFMNLQGSLAFGRAWQFFLKVQDGDEMRINPLRLAALLAACNSTHDENSTWVTYDGEYGLACLMKSFISPGDLPLLADCSEICASSVKSLSKVV